MDNGHGGNLVDKLSGLTLNDPNNTNNNNTNNDSLFQVMKAVEAAEATIKQQVLFISFSQICLFKIFLILQFILIV